jgi:hypothetical protein
LTGYAVHGGLSSNDVVRSLFPPPGGIVLTGEHDKSGMVTLDKFVNLTGTHTLTLEASTNAFRLAQYPGFPPILLPGQTLTNPPGSFTIESTAPGTAALTYTFTGDTAASNLTVSATLPFTTLFPSSHGTRQAKFIKL